ncbi:hypothetical protein EKD04_009705 [Chloroflexales bacterium ZM16-3]|nr:hypothetical protein [Chloroflexales bacterium ZM16-3]
MPLHRGRRVPPPSPEQIRRWKVVTASADDAALWATKTEHHQLGPGRIATGVVRHQRTGNYHAVISLYGNDLTVVGVFVDYAGALVMTVHISDLYVQWNERGQEASEAIQTRLHADAERLSPVPLMHWFLPDDQVRDFLAQLAESLRRAN